MNAKFTQIIEAITADITSAEQITSDAMLTLEQMNTSHMEYKAAFRRFIINTSVTRYLIHIKRAIEKSDVKTAENLIRFHAYYQHTKGGDENDPDPKDITAAVREVIVAVLQQYIADFFESPNP